MHIVQGERYRARIRLKGAEALMATKEMIVAALEDKGFADVVIYEDAAELPPDWPANKRSVETGFLEKARYGEATWTGPTQDVDLPSQVVSAWPKSEDVLATPPAPPHPPAKRDEGESVVGSTRWANAILVRVWDAMHPGDPMSTPLRHAILAVGRLEGGYGYASKPPQWAGSNNWGAIKAKRNPDGTCPGFEAYDDCGGGKATSYGKSGKSDATSGTPCCFARYATAGDGCAALVRTMLRGGVRAACETGDPAAIARAMKAIGYYTAPESHYASAIAASAAAVAKALGESPAVRPPTWERALPWTLALVGGAAIVGVTGWQLYRTGALERLGEQIDEWKELFA